jgi:hypothetical protein
MGGGMGGDGEGAREAQYGAGTLGGASGYGERSGGYDQRGNEPYGRTP